MLKVLFWGTGIFALVACNQDAKMAAVNNSWLQKDSKNIEVAVADASAAKNITFVIRNNDDYPYSNIWLIVSQKNVQSGKIQTDTINNIIASPDGSWLGSGFGSTKETQLPYKLNYHFPNNGKYIYSIRHAMRTDTLKGIEDIGIKLEEAKPSQNGRTTK